VSDTLPHPTLPQVAMLQLATCDTVLLLHTAAMGFHLPTVGDSAIIARQFKGAGSKRGGSSSQGRFKNCARGAGPEGVVALLEVVFGGRTGENDLASVQEAQLLGAPLPPPGPEGLFVPGRRVPNQHLAAAMILGHCKA
jgi:hypothetical protein